MNNGSYRQSRERMSGSNPDQQQPNRTNQSRRVVGSISTLPPFPIFAVSEIHEANGCLQSRDFSENARPAYDDALIQEIVEDDQDLRQNQIFSGQFLGSRQSSAQNQQSQSTPFSRFPLFPMALLESLPNHVGQSQTYDDDQNSQEFEDYRDGDERDEDQRDHQYQRDQRYIRDQRDHIEDSIENNESFRQTPHHPEYMKSPRPRPRSIVPRRDAFRDVLRTKPVVATPKPQPSTHSVQGFQGPSEHLSSAAAPSEALSLNLKSIEKIVQSITKLENRMDLGFQAAFRRFETIQESLTSMNQKVMRLEKELLNDSKIQKNATIPVLDLLTMDNMSTNFTASSTASHADSHSK